MSKKIIVFMSTRDFHEVNFKRIAGKKKSKIDSSLIIM